MKFLEFIYEMKDLHVQIEVENADGEVINDIIDALSFVYKKRADRYVRPKTIKGKMSNGELDMDVIMHNKDVIKIHFKGGNLSLNINDELVYDMDDIDEKNLAKKIHDVYSKHISDQKFTVMKKFNEI